MAKVTQVVLMACKSYNDGRRKFKQNVPVTIHDPADIERYQSNALFSVRVIDDKRADVGVQAQRVNPADPFNAAVSEETTRIPPRKKKTLKKASPKPKSDSEE